MNKRKIVEFTNWTALISIAILVYWVFIFISVTVFGFKVFRENMTEAFYLSILGIFAILAGSIILNIMMNMTLISEHIGQKRQPENGKNKVSRKPIILITFMSFPIIFLLLYMGDMNTSNVKEKLLLNSVESLVNEYPETLDKLSNYTFSEEFINNTANDLKILSRVEKNIPVATLIVKDEINGKDVFLEFRQWNNFSKNNNVKEKFIFSTDIKERKYLLDVFSGKTMKHYFSGHDGEYEFYYPV